VRPGDLNERQRQVAERIFAEEVFGIFTPMAVSGHDDFPLLTNQTLSLCVQLAGEADPPSTDGSPPGDTAPGRLAVIPLGRLPNRFVPLPTEAGFAYLLLEDVVTLYVERLFPGQTVEEVVPFRITRNADLGVREDMAADLLAGMEQVLDQRKQSACVRLELTGGASSSLSGFLQSALEIGDDQLYTPDGPLDLAAYMKLVNLTGFDQLRYEAWPPQPSPLVDGKTSMFEVIQRADVLLSQPYESFEPVVRLINEAADDPDVLSLKIILYRTSGSSPIVAALARAAASGKQVTAILELKARFDEARNIEWARALEQEGVQVIYGIRGLKTHAKVCVITRREPQGIQRYVHFSTGNYNEVTARQYTDISYLTCDEDLTADAASFFNAISGYSQPQKFRKLSAAPHNLRDRILELIDGEVARRREGQDAHIMAQLNALADPQVIDALYAASQAGVKIDLNVRGICCLQPGVAGLSDNIRVVSILDRYLEHGRILYFLHGGERLVFISSADWMPRNLDRRIELLIPIEDPSSRDRLIEILASYAADNVKGRRLLASGGYEKWQPARGESNHRHQRHLYQLACAAEQQATRLQRTTFIPHRSAGNGAPPEDGSTKTAADGRR
nr:polyphosphate kinase 1 [Planctomycetales bacterium]